MDREVVVRPDPASPADALRESEELLRTTLAIAPIGIAQAEPDTGRLLLVNDALCRMLGYTAEELVGRQIHDLTHPADRERDDAGFRRAVSSEAAGHAIEKRYLRKDGSVVWGSVRMEVLRDASGNATRSVATIEDVTERREAESALRASEQRFRAMFEFAAMGVAQAVPATGMWTAVNPRFCAITGYSESELLSMRVSELTHPEDRERDWLLFQRVVRGDLPEYRIEKRYVRKDGSVAWVNVNMVVLRDEKGKAERTLAMIEDITERKESETNVARLNAELEHALDWQRQIFEGSRDAVFLSDEEGRFVAVNGAAAELTGFSRQELLSMTIPDLHEEPDLTAYSAFHRRIFEGERILSEAPVRRKDGTKVSVEFNNSVVGIGGKRFMHTAGRDVTERRRAAEALAASEGRYRVLFETAAEGIVGIDPDTQRFLFFNPALCAMFGYTAEEFGELTLEDIHPKSAQERLLGEIRTMASGVSLVSPAIPCLRKDGTTFAADARGSLIEAAGRKFVVGFFTEITERVRLEEQLRQSQKMEAVGQLAGGVAHDFNNLLTVITGNCDLLLGGTSHDDPKRGPLADIHAAAERAANLTRQLLAFSRKQILEPKLVDVNDVLRDMERLLRRLIGEDIDLATDFAANPSWVKVDRGQLEQVVMNLAVNARDAMPRGGRLTLRTHNSTPLGVVDLEETAERGLRPRVAISIVDSGTGIPPEVRARLFEPFFTTKEAGKGTGLGLATVYGIVKQSGGDITVESEPGRGSTFTVVLPSKPAPRRRGSSASNRTVPRGTETILAVEDEDAVRRIVKIALESTGYRVIEARSGPEALEAGRRHPGRIDLLVTDVVMPEMSGRDLAERFVKEHPGIRILYMSGYTDDAVVRHGVAGAGVAFLQKPFSPLALARKVREVLDAKA